MKRSKKTFILAAVLVLLLAGAGLLYNKLSQGRSLAAPGRGQCFLLPGEQPRPRSFLSP